MERDPDKVSAEVAQLARKLFELGKRTTTTSVALAASIFAAVKLVRSQRHDHGLEGSDYDVIWQGLSLMAPDEAPSREEARATWERYPPPKEFSSRDVGDFVEKLLRETRKATKDPAVAMLSLLHLGLAVEYPGSNAVFIAVDYLSAHPDLERQMKPTDDEVEAIVADVTAVLRCLCGARIYADDTAMTLAHEGTECAAFVEIVERNRSGNPYVEDPQRVTTSEEQAEARIMMAKTSAKDILSLAGMFGLRTTDVKQASLRILREMRARGWSFWFPS